MAPLKGDYPDDADGDALRRVAATGVDMSRPMEIEFIVAVPGRVTGEAIARLVARAGFRPELIHDEEDDAWDCYCRTTMLPTYGQITAAQRRLDGLIRPFGCYCDGWGTLIDQIDA